MPDRTVETLEEISESELPTVEDPLSDPRHISGLFPKKKKRRKKMKRKKIEGLYTLACSLGLPVGV